MFLKNRPISPISVARLAFIFFFVSSLSVGVYSRDKHVWYIKAWNMFSSNIKPFKDLYCEDSDSYFFKNALLDVKNKNISPDDVQNTFFVLNEQRLQGESLKVALDDYVGAKFCGGKYRVETLKRPFIDHLFGKVNGHD